MLTESSTGSNQNERDFTKSVQKIYGNSCSSNIVLSKKKKIFSEQITFDFGSADLPVFKKNDVWVFKGLLLVATDKQMRCAMYTKSKQLGNTKCAFWDHKDCFTEWS